MSLDTESSAELTGPDNQSRPEEIATQEPGGRLTAVRTEFHQGPLPPPEDFAAYESVVPGGAERILALAERSVDLKEQHLQAEMRESDQIHEESMSYLGASTMLQSRGQWMAFICVVLILVGSGFLVATGTTGFTIAGLVNFTLALGALVYRFVRTDFGDRRHRSPAEHPDADRLPQLPEALRRSRQGSENTDS